jgi:hypothetical protein
VVFESRINLKRRITLGAMTAPIVKKEVPREADVRTRPRSNELGAGVQSDNSLEWGRYSRDSLSCMERSGGGIYPIGKEGQ